MPFRKKPGAVRSKTAVEGSTNVAMFWPAPEWTGTKSQLLTSSSADGLGLGPIVFAMNWTVSAVVREASRGWRGAAKTLVVIARARVERVVVECIIVSWNYDCLRVMIGFTEILVRDR